MILEKPFFIPTNNFESNKIYISLFIHKRDNINFFHSPIFMSNHHLHNLHLQRKGTFPMEGTPLHPPSVHSIAHTQTNFHHVRSQLESENERLMDQRKNLINRSRTNRNPSSKDADYQESSSRGFNGSGVQQNFNKGSQIQSKIQ